MYAWTSECPFTYEPFPCIPRGRGGGGQDFLLVGMKAYPSEHPFTCEPFYCIVCLRWGGEGSGGLVRKEGGRARFSVDW